MLDFIARHPAHALRAAPQYWIGEACFVQRDYRHAVVEFRRVVEMAPASPRAADALLRIGMCHATLGESARAVAAWQRVARDYPRSDAAGTAAAPPCPRRDPPALAYPRRGVDPARRARILLPSRRP